MVIALTAQSPATTTVLLMDTVEATMTAWVPAP